MKRSVDTATIEQLWRDYSFLRTNGVTNDRGMHRRGFEAAVIELLERIRKGELQP